MILLIDNYDSFSYNLYQLIGSAHSDIKVVRNDALTLEEIEALAPSSIVLSPGPGRPEQAGICVDAVRRFAGKIPILGVCLGHQAICQAFGGIVTYAKQLMHGKTSEIEIDPTSRLYRGLCSPITVARYHSLSVDRSSLPNELIVTAATPDGEVMSVEHQIYPVFGVQFHPESVMTKDGKTLIQNFLEVSL